MDKNMSKNKGGDTARYRELRIDNIQNQSQNILPIDLLSGPKGNEGFGDAASNI